MPRASPNPLGPPRRVLILTPQPFFEERGTPIALLDVMRGLVELGYEVDLLGFPIGTDVPLPGVRYFRTPNPFGFRSIPIGFSLRKLLLDFHLPGALRRRLDRDSYLWVHAVEEAAFVAVQVCRPRGIPVLYDMASSIPEQLSGRFPFSLGILRHLMSRMERRLLRRANTVMCSAGLGPRVRELAPDTRVFEWLYPGVEHVECKEQVEEVRRQLDLPAGGPVVLYSGTFEPYQGLPLLLRAIPLVLERAPRTVFVFVGAKSERDIVRSRSEVPPELRDRVRFVRRQPRERIAAFLSLSDVLVSPRSHGANLPLKIFDYLASGRPIVATDIPAHRTVLDESRAVLVRQEPSALAEGIRGLIEDPERARELGAAGRAFYTREFGWSRFVDLIREIYEDGAAPRWSRAAAS